MRAVLVTARGEPPSVGQIADPILGETLVPGFPIDEPGVPAREPGPHPASLVEVTFAAINPIDLHIASGRFFQGDPHVPYVPGVEGVGRVVRSESYPEGTRVRFELGHPGYGANGSMAQLTVADDAGKTRVTVVQTGFGSAEERDFFAREAWQGAFDRIVAYLASR